MKIRLFVFFAALLSAAAFAGPGHDHGEAAAPQATGRAAPKFSTHSDLFEVVGVVDGPHLDVYVDRFSDNAPVVDAKVEIESGKVKLVGKFLKDEGVYEFEAAAFKANGIYPIVVTVSDGKESEILAAELAVGQNTSSHHDGFLHAVESWVASPRLITGIVGFSAGGIAALWWFMRRRNLKKGGV
jgi:membrane fusion protein, heavy metal efflux system